MIGWLDVGSWLHKQAIKGVARANGVVSKHVRQRAGLKEEPVERANESLTQVSS